MEKVVFGRKQKHEAQKDQGVDRRKVQRGNTPQAFSYYTSRVSEPTERRAPSHKAPEPKEQKLAKPKRRARNFLATLPYWLLIVVVCACAVKILSLSGDPRIVIVGEGTNTNSYVQSSGVYATAAQKLLASSITNRSKLTVNTNGITQNLKKEFPELVDVSMSIPLVSNRPVVYIQPSEPSILLDTTTGDFAMNSTGFILTNLSAPPSGLPIVVDQSGIIPHAGKQLLPSSTVSFIGTVEYQFATAHLAITTFTLPANSPYELDVHLVGKPYTVRFNLESDALTQSGAAIATIQQLGSTVPKGYIDVRVPGRVYYK